MTDKGVYTYWLGQIPGLGRSGAIKLLQQFQTAERVYRESGGRYEDIVGEKQAAGLRSSRKLLPLREYEDMKAKGICQVSILDPGYPQRLKKIPDPPYSLFVSGRLPADDIPAVAVIGARDCSEYGRYVARSLGEALGAAGVSLISGMARGIDGIAQEGALRSGGTSYGVLGCGVDICYPVRNKSLYHGLIKQGGVTSEYYPGTTPKGSLFPPRNRIVSGLADAVVVIEARQKSGTLITVDMALEQGREVYVVPGRITDRLSDGCNKLLKQGAAVLLSPEDLLGEIGRVIPKEPLREEGGTAAGDDIMSRVLGILDVTPLTIAEIGKQIGEACDYAELVGILIALCAEGRAVQVSSGRFRKQLR